MAVHGTRSYKLTNPSHTHATTLLLLAAVTVHHVPVLAQTIPEWLPEYQMDVKLDIDQRKVSVRQRVRWTNMSKQATSQLVFNAYARYKIPEGEVALLAKTLELLRAPPSEAIDNVGRRLRIERVTDAQGRPLPFHFREDLQTALIVELAAPVRPSETVTVVLEFTLDLPEKQGRWGHWRGVTYLVNWYPIVAYYDDQGWHPTPFVAWHQPFFNEAGVYSVRLTCPKDQKIASTGTIIEQEEHGNGWKTVQIVGCCARDFALVCSHRYEEHVAQAEHVRVRVLAFPEHRHYALKALQFACEVIPLYNRWFGLYPYDEFDIVECHFPWNGNESSGLIMIDERVFSMPRMAELYVDHLVTHETLHQWWYNVVGTDGYRETWMDEAVASYYTARRMKAKYGDNPQLIRYPPGFHWLPNIRLDDYRFAGMYGTIRRGELTATVQPLPGFGNIVTLFSMTYDRGSLILRMIEARVGPEAFAEFMRTIYRKYRFRILRVADFQRELEAYTGQSWQAFFDQWLYGPGMSDWSIEEVDIRRLEKHYYRAKIRVVQKGTVAEPTLLGVRFEADSDFSLRVPLLPGVTSQLLDGPPGRITSREDGSIEVELLLPARPVELAVDPDRVIPDANPVNNRWPPPIQWRITPLYTPLEETDLTIPHDQWLVVFGPWVGINAPPFGQRPYTGFRVGLQRLQTFHGGIYIAYDVEDRDTRLGADAIVDHWPLPHAQVGFQVDHSVTPEIAETRQDRGRVFARYIFTYTPSLYLDPIEFIEVFGRVENEFWRGHEMRLPGKERYDDLAAVGVRYQRNFYTPYWDPEAGYRVDVQAEHGMTILGGDETYQRLEGEVALVRGVPDGLGPLSATRLAARVYAGLGDPAHGEHFRLGGSRRLRALDPARRQGSAVWVATLEWRVPLWRDLDFDAVDHVARLRHLYAVVFYEAGASYFDHRLQGEVVHSLGTGLRLDTAWFSFIERVTFRLDIAKTLNTDDPAQLWLGWQHAF
ncbi:MAG: aminopeptidase [Gemmataceae bacterium]